MIPVYICDDNEKEKDYLKKMTENLILIHDYDMRVVLAAGTPEEIIEHRQTHTNRSVYILDVDLKHKTYSGFTLAKRLRELDTRGFIVFVTTHEEMMYETFRYRLEAMDYLIKEEPVKLMKRLQECISEINKLAGNDKNDCKDYFTVKTDGCAFHIPKNDILYVKTAGEIHRVTLYAKDRMLEFRGDLSALEKDLGADFLRIHRSFLVRTDKIKQINYGSGMLVMEDGSTCLISRKGKRLLKAYFKDEVS